MGCVRTPIFGRPRRLPGPRHAHRRQAAASRDYTVNWEVSALGISESRLCRSMAVDDVDADRREGRRPRSARRRSSCDERAAPRPDSGLITQRSEVQILPPLQVKYQVRGPFARWSGRVSPVHVRTMYAEITRGRCRTRWDSCGQHHPAVGSRAHVLVRRRAQLPLAGTRGGSTGSSRSRVWVGGARRWLGRGRGLPMMEVLTPPIRKTSTCATLPSRVLTGPRSAGWTSSVCRSPGSA